MTTRARITRSGKFTGGSQDLSHALLQHSLTALPRSLQARQEDGLDGCHAPAASPFCRRDLDAWAFSPSEFYAALRGFFQRAISVEAQKMRRVVPKLASPEGR